MRFVKKSFLFNYMDSEMYMYFSIDVDGRTHQIYRRHKIDKNFTEVDACAAIKSMLSSGLQQVTNIDIKKYKDFINKAYLELRNERMLYFYKILRERRMAVNG